MSHSLNILFPSVFPTKIVCELLISLIRAKFALNFLLLNSKHPNKILQRFQIMQLVIMQLFSTLLLPPPSQAQITPSVP